MEFQQDCNIKDLILSEDWTLVLKFYAIERIKWMVLFLLSPIWLCIKVVATLTIKVYTISKDWPWFLIRFAISELFLVTIDIGSDTMQGIKLTR